MTNIKTSRKGTRLNDARYFRLSLPHMRTRMTVIRVIPRITDPEFDRLHLNQDSTKPNSGFGTNMKPRDRDRIVKLKQSSIEMGFIKCHGFDNIDQNKEGHQDTCVETEVIELSKDPSFLTQRKDVLAIIQNDSEKSTKFSRIKDDHQKIIQKIVCSGKLQSQEHSCKSVERKQNCSDRIIEVEEEKNNSWWKEGGQKFLQLFAKILGKRGGNQGIKRPTELIGKQPGKHAKRISRNSKSHNRYRRDDDVIRLKRVDNGYIANHVYRDESNWYGSMAENKWSEEQHHPSILVRQIQRTRDKNLRIMLLEQELHIHLLKTTKRDIRLSPNGAVNIKQLSSPLC